eukprot:GHVT01078892.1.p1 GENE.GHVT01078892.1~~GHVT01078892.1.p1  ORF type:complete len:128 (+),score=6.09 GHVT01078892.1:225-608(+)
MCTAERPRSYGDAIHRRRQLHEVTEHLLERCSRDHSERAKWRKITWLTAACFWVQHYFFLAVFFSKSAFRAASSALAESAFFFLNSSSSSVVDVTFLGAFKGFFFPPWDPVTGILNDGWNKLCLEEC